MVQCPEHWLKRRSPTEWGWLLYLFSLFLISLEAPQASWRLTAVQCNNKINLELCSAPFSSYLGLFENQGEVYQKPQIPFSHVLLNRGAMAFLLLCHLVGPGEHNILPWHCLTSVGSGGSRPAPRSVFALSSHPVSWGMSLQFFRRSQNSFTAQYIIIYIFWIPGTPGWYEIYYSKFKSLHSLTVTLKSFREGVFVLFCFFKLENLIK